MKKHRKILVVVAVLLILTMTISQCITRKQEAPDPRGPAFSASGKCANCHGTKHKSFAHTAHDRTSALASLETIRGNFAKDSNQYYYRPNVKLVMEKRDSSLYQVAYQDDIEKRASRFDIVIGSGRKAQTFLYWENNNVFQLPVSWSVNANNWVNSPNYPPRQVRFDRSIPIGCFECHSSYIKQTGQQVAGDRLIDDFSPGSLITGIDCQRCHGPAAKHVEFHEDHPGVKEAAFIPVYSKLSRKQQIASCAVCHSGINAAQHAAFGFVPGDTIPEEPSPASAETLFNLDVHGNQAQLLQASKCYLQSNDLNCTSCHDPHQNERARLELFSNRCVSCHKDLKHSFPEPREVKSNCIDCHMPALPSKLISLLSNGQDSAAPALVRTHYISIYPKATQQFRTK